MSNGGNFKGCGECGHLRMHETVRNYILHNMRALNHILHKTYVWPKVTAVVELTNRDLHKRPLDVLTDNLEEVLTWFLIVSKFELHKILIFLIFQSFLTFLNVLPTFEASINLRTYFFNLLDG
jgi:hypothetical protein